MELSPLAERLLVDVRLAHEALGDYTQADTAISEGLHAVAAAISAALSDLSDDDLLSAPAPEEWSMAEVVEHVHEHDRTYDEVARHGAAHYVEHGLEHALQIWKLRRGLGLSTAPTA